MQVEVDGNDRAQIEHEANSSSVGSELQFCFPENVAAPSNPIPTSLLSCTVEPATSSLF